MADGAATERRERALAKALAGERFRLRELGAYVARLEAAVREREALIERLCREAGGREHG